jgi:phosphoglycolate phosphatase-like HAD superfamily hydrolase
VLIGGDSLPNKKPHPEPVLSAMRTMRVENAKRTVMIGDSPNDIDSGRTAGTRTCGVRSNISDHRKLLNSRPDFAVANIRELIRIFR